MNKENKVQIEGNKNISLQDIQTNGGNITIVIGNDLPQEVKDEKEQLGKQIKIIGNELSVLSKIVEQNNISNIPIAELDINIDWEELLTAIEFGDCVLFIGQEISTDANGNPLHEKLFADLGKTAKIKFIEDEGFYEPAQDGKIRLLSNKIAKHYKKNFNALNKNGQIILEKLAQIPFSQIISVTPDNTMHQVYNNFGIKHQFIYYTGEKLEVTEPTLDNPIIFNILGEIEKREYIYTHEQFYNYLKNMDINPKIEEKLKYATHFLFLGFDFNKWYNRLLLFIMNISNKDGDSFRHLIQKQNIKDKFKNIINKQFGISFIANEYNSFTDMLLQKIKTESDIKTRDLKKYFVEQSYNKLLEINRDFVDEKTLNGLHTIKNDLISLHSKIENFK